MRHKRRTCAKLCHTSGGELEQIQFLLGLAAQRILTVPNTVALDQNQVKSKWRKLVVRTPLADIIVAKNTDEQQTQAIYERFAEWGRVLFEDGTLESAFRDTWPKDVPWNAAPPRDCGQIA